MRFVRSLNSLLESARVKWYSGWSVCVCGMNDDEKFRWVDQVERRVLFWYMKHLGLSRGGVMVSTLDEQVPALCRFSNNFRAAPACLPYSWLPNVD